MFSHRLWLWLSMSVVSAIGPALCQSQETKTLVVMIDHDSTGFIYRVAGKSTSPDLLTYLNEHISEWPTDKTRVILLVHEQVTLAMINNSRGMIMKAGFEPPRVFHFNDDKRTMVEITFLRAVPYSAKGQTPRTRDSFLAIQLLEGYSAKRQSAVDASAWTIAGKNGFRIEYEAGPNQGSAADPAKMEDYSWYREQKVNGYLARFALIKVGVKSVFEPKDSRGQPPGNILLVTFLLEGPKSDFAANFQAKIRNEGELADTMLIVTTYQPKRWNK